MTLTVPDVEKWEPDHLTSAGTQAKTISANLDTAVAGGSDKTRGLNWSGTAGNAANTRMDTEKTRASTVSAALLELQTAFTSQVENLKNAKSKVLSLRDLATNPASTAAGTEPAPGFKVEANGTVTADDRIAKITALMNGQQKVDESLRIQREAAQWQVDITNALQQAEGVATQAQTQVTQAVAKLRAAYDGLGDPKSGTAPAATPTTPASTPAANSPSSSGVSNSSSNSSHVTGNHNNSFSGSSSGTPHSSGSSSGGPSGPMPTGDKAKWIQEALKVLKDMGYDTSDPNLVADISTIIEKESGDNPHAFNGWDSNAAAGTPSKGLMQTIDSTFNAHKAPGHDDVWNPVDNIVAGVRYATDRYGSVHDVPGLVAMRSGGPYQGY
ncbi:transglycosylase SLT domain-containing protein [Nocardia australiensis]|uniref:transglycosylase SLT domain-containing protein n=1 Tax=Nocardia australiensis TaxID=2887191 RepID=UPI001D145F4B|nr:transglycosylase SLT domain-containing protein [Nocardia australiensis]